MSIRQVIVLGWLCAVCAAAQPANQLTPEEQQQGYRLLFNGHNLDGWDGDRQLWSVKDGTIVGCSDEHPFKVNTFLIYKDEFADFILKADVRLRNHNSGIQFRSTHIPGPDWIVMGLQADISDEPGREAWGNFYEERGRSRTMMKTPDEGWLKAKPVVDMHGWNHYEIFAQGDHIRLTLNGVVTIDTHEGKSRSGVIALQLHGGKPMKVEFREIKIKTLAPAK
jgi:hypothetical protein